MADNKSEEKSLKPGPIDVVKHRKIYLGISLLLMVPGIIFMFLSMQNYETHAPLRLGIDFTGGTILELGFEKKLTQDDIPAIRTVFEEKGYAGSVVQLQEPRHLSGQTPEQAASTPAAVTTPNTTTAPVMPAAPATATTPETVKGAPEQTAATTNAHAAPSAATEQSATATPSTATPAATTANAETPAKPAVVVTPAAIETDPEMKNVATIVSVRSKQLSEADYPVIKADLEKHFGTYVLMQRNSIGPTLASELLTNGVIALVLAYVLIIGYLTFRFQFDYAVCAIVALVHDTITVVGLFSMMGYLFHTEIDSLFITGILTVVGFSVHDTIVVYDRLRENSRRYYSQKLSFDDIANISVNQTLARSINTSVTALLTLLALFFLGGETTRDFVLCMIMGIAIGTYSSIFVASALLAWWRERQEGGNRRATPATA